MSERESDMAKTDFDSRVAGTIRYTPEELRNRPDGYLFSVGSKRSKIESINGYKYSGTINFCNDVKVPRGRYKVEKIENESVRVKYTSEDGKNRVSVIPTERVTMIKKEHIGHRYAFLNY